MSKPIRFWGIEVHSTEEANLIQKICFENNIFWGTGNPTKEYQQVSDCTILCSKWGNDTRLTYGIISPMYKPYLITLEEFKKRYPKGLEIE